MTIRVVCKQCQSKLDIREELAGSTRKCPKCKTEFVVPKPEIDEAEEGVALVVESEEAADSTGAAPLAATAEFSPPLTDDAPLPAPMSSAATADEEDDDDGDEDFMPSFVTAPVAEKPETKTPLPATKPSAGEDGDDDSPVFSIPKTPPPTKPKFKPFDPEEFAEEATPRPKKREIPASLMEERPPRARRDELDDPSDAGGMKPRKGSGDLKLPAPGKSKLSDSNAGVMSGGTRDRAQAARELRQALKESTLKAPVEEETTRGGLGFDFSALMSEIGLKGLALIAGACLVAVGVYFVSDQAMGGKLKLPKLGYVSGTVTYDGAPAVGATVYFQPVVEENAPADGKKREKKRTSYGQTDDKGHYKLMYIEGVQGVAVGKCRVWLQLQPPQVVPGEYSQASITIKEVAAGSQTVDFPLTAPPKRR